MSSPRWADSRAAAAPKSSSGSTSYAPSSSRPRPTPRSWRSRPPRQAQAGPRDQHRHILTRADAAARDHAHARQAAQRRDQEAAEASYRRAARLTDQQLADTEHVAALHAEHDLRERQLPALHMLEEQERTAALQPAAVAPQTSEVEIGDCDVTSPDLRVLDPGHLAVMAPMPHEINREIDRGAGDR